MTALRVNESSGSAGSIQVADGFGGFLSGSLTAGPNITISNDGSGSFAITASIDAGTAIGEAEDGTYADGLFTDFAIDTPIGTAVDRINEVLKALAPTPAPPLDDINSLQTGTNLFLSFGSSNDRSSSNPAYISVGGGAGISSAVDVNGAYNITTSSNNIRLGAFAGDTHISGVLNADVSANSQGNSILVSSIVMFVTAILVAAVFVPKYGALGAAYSYVLSGVAYCITIHLFFAHFRAKTSLSR